jgi:hypothetical protein
VGDHNILSIIIFSVGLDWGVPGPPCLRPWFRLLTALGKRLYIFYMCMTELKTALSKAAQVGFNVQLILKLRQFENMEYAITKQWQQEVSDVSVLFTLDIFRVRKLRQLFVAALGLSLPREIYFHN